MSDILSAEQLASALEIHPDTIRKFTREGTIPHHRFGSVVRYCLADVLNATVVKQHPDDEAVDRFAAAMHAKMAAARAKGKEGWDDPGRYSQTHLLELLDCHLESREWVDVANYAMMLHMRGGE